MNRSTVLYRMTYFSAIFGAFLAACIAILTGVADPARVAVIYRGMPEIVIMAAFGLGAAVLFGVGLWLWVAEERILSRSH